jgi:hypothetical protein
MRYIFVSILTAFVMLIIFSFVHEREYCIELTEKGYRVHDNTKEIVVDVPVGELDNYILNENK